MRIFGLFLAICGVMNANAVTFVCFAAPSDLISNDPQVVLEDPILMPELGEETYQFGFTFDGYGRDDDLTVFDEEPQEPVAGVDFASNTSWEAPVSRTSDFAMIASW